MKIKSGIEQISTYKQLPLVIDWDDLLWYKGKLHQQEAFQRMLGGLILVMGCLSVGVGGGWIFLSGLWSSLGLFPAATLPELLIWLGLGLILYSSYLRRDRNLFAFDLEQRTLSELDSKISKGKLKQIEVDDYFSYPLYKVIEADYYDHNSEFVDTMIGYVLSQDVVAGILTRLGVDPDSFKQKALSQAKTYNTSFETHYQGLLTAVFNEALELGQDQITSVSFFFVFAQHLWDKILLESGVSQDELAAMQMWVATENAKLRYRGQWHKLALLKPTGTVNRAYTSVHSPIMEAYAEDYTREAAQGDFTLSMGREVQLNKLINTLQVRGKAALMVGASGVGKSQLLRHLAVMMVVEDVPSELRDKRLVVFDFTQAFTKSASIEEFKLLLQELFEHLRRTENVVLVLDEIQQLLNLREEYRVEVVSIIQNGIHNHGLQIVATTTLASYRKLVEPDQSLASLFEVIEIPEPNNLVSLQILIDDSAALEKQFGVKIQVNALKQVIKLAPAVEHEKMMPEKALDLLQECLGESQRQGLEYLTETVVGQVVSRSVGTKVGPISPAESEMLLKLEDNLHKKVVGQHEAIQAVAAALRRSRAGFNKPGRPIASMLFYGPTGVGKTEVCKTLAATYYGDEKLMIRLDMSEYQEEKNLERLIGSLNEKGEFSGGYLTEAVRQKPFSLVLLDELEKANPKVLDIFLQILDEGMVTDGAGRKVSFDNTIIIATSNAGSRQIAEQVAAGKRYKEIAAVVEPVLREVYKVEFLNRFDRIIMFQPLSLLEVQEITRRMMYGLANDMLEQGITIQFSEIAVQELAALGYDPIYGARQLARTIQENVQDKIAELIVKGEVRSGSSLHIQNLNEFKVR